MVMLRFSRQLNKILITNFLHRQEFSCHSLRCTLNLLFLVQLLLLYVLRCVLLLANSLFRMCFAFFVRELLLFFTCFFSSGCLLDLNGIYLHFLNSFRFRDGDGCILILILAKHTFKFVFGIS
jgi:hypothetical protein